MAPAIMGNTDRPELGAELTNSFCRTDPAIAKHFARVTFTSDNRDDLPQVRARTLILQCKDDIIASERVGDMSIATSQPAVLWCWTRLVTARI
jgi:sigma-B regulation protein RsbQ